MACTFSIKTFDELTAVDVYHLLKARVQVFILEKKQYVQHIDEVDFDSLHLVAHKDGELIGYLRMVLPADHNVVQKRFQLTKAKPLSPISIDMLFMLPDHRGYGLAKQMVAHAIKHIHKQYRKRDINVLTATDVMGFYTTQGFEVIGEPFSKDGLSYINLRLGSGKKSKHAPATPVPAKSSSKSSAMISIVYGVMVIMMTLFIAGILYLMV